MTDKKSKTIGLVFTENKIIRHIPMADGGIRTVEEPKKKQVKAK